MKIRWQFAAAFWIVLAVSGCFTVGRWLAPIKQTELEPAAQKVIAAKDAVIATNTQSADKTIAALKAEIAKLKVNKPTPLWPLYLIGAFALAFGVGVGYLLKAIGVGVMFALGGAASIATAQFIERYPWFMWIPVGIGTAAGAFFLYDWYRGVKGRKLAADRAKVRDVLVSAIERIEPKKVGFDASGPVKEAILITALSKHVVPLVKSEVAEAKARLGIK